MDWTALASSAATGLGSAAGLGSFFFYLFKRNQRQTDQAAQDSKIALVRIKSLDEAIKTKKDIAVCDANLKGFQDKLGQILTTSQATERKVDNVKDRVSDIEGYLRARNGNGAKPA